MSDSWAVQFSILFAVVFVVFLGLSVVFDDSMRRGVLYGIAIAGAFAGVSTFLLHR